MKYKIYQVGEVELNDYFINSVSIKYNTENLNVEWNNIIKRDEIANYTLTIENDYFEFEILHLNNRDKKEILYLFDIFKQLTKYEIDFRHYNELQEVIEDSYGKYMYKYNEEWEEYDIKKREISEEIKNILKHLQNEFYIEIDIEFAKKYSNKKIIIRS